MNVDDIKKLKVAKVKVQKSLLFFTRYYFKKRFRRNFVVNEHHEIISDALEKVIKGEIKRLIINLAPRYSKTELAVKNFIAHCLALNPSSKFIHLSYSDDLALDNSEEIKDFILSEDYQQLFPDVQLKKDSKSKKKWYTTKGGGVYATSASGQVTGFGAGKVDEEDEEDLIEFISDIEEKKEFGGAIIIDDPIKPDDADSDTKRDRINNKYDSTIKNRTNSRNTPIIIIMQRLHPEDLTGYLTSMEDHDWTVISLPCIKEDGTALWEFKHTIEELNKERNDNSVVFDRQYMQDPRPLEGIVFESLKYYDKLNDNEGLTVAYADTADEGTDYFAMPICKIIGGKCYIIDVVFNPHNLDVNIPMLKAMIEKYEIDHLVIETNKEGELMVKILRQEMKACRIVGTHSVSNKMVRIFAQSGFIMDNFLFKKDNPVNSDYHRFVKQTLKLLKTSKKEDDAPDSLAGLAKFIRTKFKSILT